ncbi:hypothetical protein KR084_009487, partial [Drosophila pseudotakahashii]
YFFVLITINAALKANAKSRQRAKLAGDEPLRAYNEVVQNLIRNWESPVVFLRDRGFLPKNFEDTSKIKPNLDALMQRIERAKRDEPIVKIQHREMREIKRPKNALRNHRSFLATSGSMLSNLEQLKALDSKATKSKSRVNEQELQLLAMKRRLEQLQQGADSQDPPGYRRQIKLIPKAKDPVKSAQSYDEVLQRMIEKTSPHFKQHPNLHLDKVAPLANHRSTNVQLVSKEDKLLHSAPLSLSTYRAQSYQPNLIDLPKSSRAQEAKEVKDDAIESELAAPRYLNWDMKKGRLDNYSSVEKEAYLNQLVRVFGQNLDLKETQPK